MKTKIILTIMILATICAGIYGTTSESAAAYMSQSYHCSALYDDEEFSYYNYVKTDGNDLIYLKNDRDSKKKKVIKKCTVKEDGSAEVKKYVLKDKKMSARGMHGMDIILCKQLGKEKYVNGNAVGISKKKYRIAILNKKGIITNTYDIPIATKIKKSKIAFIEINYVKIHNKKLYVDYYISYNSKEQKKGNYGKEFFLC